MDSCETFRTWASARRDGELPLRQELALDGHLEGCVECQAYAVSLEAVVARLQQADVAEAAPAGLATRVRAAIGAARPARKAGSARKARFYLTYWGRWLAVPAATAAALLAVVMILPTANDARFADHVHAVASRHPTDMVATDLTALTPWFVQKVNYAPPVLAASEVGCELLGGRIADIADKKTAALAYSCGGHDVTVYVEPSGKGTKAPVAQTRDGYHMVSWRGAKLACQAVSDLDQAQLLRLARFIQAHAQKA